jgi:hypothetical protein
MEVHSLQPLSVSASRIDVAAIQCPAKRCRRGREGECRRRTHFGRQLHDLGIPVARPDTSGGTPVQGEEGDEGLRRSRASERVPDSCAVTWNASTRSKGLRRGDKQTRRQESQQSGSTVKDPSGAGHHKPSCRYRDHAACHRSARSIQGGSRCTQLGSHRIGHGERSPMGRRQPSKAKAPLGLQETDGADCQQAKVKPAQASGSKMAHLVPHQRDKQNPKTGEQPDE